MARDWESTFRTWGGALGDTEDARCAHAETAIRKAISASPALNSRTIRVFAQGSYKNSTNVPAESDVDVCVLCTDTFFHDFTFAGGATAQTVGVLPATYTYSQFKNDLQAALEDWFDASRVHRGDKAFTIRANTYRVQADAIACFEHRRYLKNPLGLLHYESGTQFVPDSGGTIVNWPEQHHTNGIAKNKATARRFKAMVRVLKNLRHEMDDAGIAAATPLASFLIECLVYNVPNEAFGNLAYLNDVRGMLVSIYNATKTDESCNGWLEVHDRKYLFRPSQPWTREQAHAFSIAAWHYLGLS